LPGFHLGIEFLQSPDRENSKNVLMVSKKVAEILKNPEIKGAASDFGRAGQSGRV
jgi:hypothetical protein